MAEPNPFAFTGVNVPQLSSSEASLRAEVARAKRDVAVLQREVRDANDATGLARARAAAQEAERESKRAQMAERIARKALDDLRNSHRMAQESTASQQAAVKSTEVSTAENGKPQAECETAAGQGLPARTAESADDTSDSHDSHDSHDGCRRARKELIDRFQQHFQAESLKATATNDELEAANNRLEATNKTLREHLQDLERRLAEAQGDREKLRDEAERNRQDLESVANLKNELYTLRGTHHDLLGEIDQRDFADIADADSRNRQQQAERQAAQARLDEATAEIRRLSHEVEKLWAELQTARDDNRQLEDTLDHQRKVDAHLTETNDLLRADLAAAQAKRRLLAVERDELEVRLAKTDHTLQETERSESEARHTLEIRQAELDSAVHDAMQQYAGFQDDVNGLHAQVEEHASDIAVKDQRIELLEHENKVLTSELEDARARRPSTEDVPRPVNLRSISMASHNSLADELGLDDEGFIGAFSDDEEPATETVDLGLSAVHHINIASYEVAAPRLTVSISDAVATTPQRQGSSIEYSLVSSVSSIEPTHPAPPELSMYNDAVADFAPSRHAVPGLSFFEKTVQCLSPQDPRPAQLAVSEISQRLDYAPVEASTTCGLQLLFSHVGETLNYSPVEPAIPLPPAAPKAQRLTMHVFNHSVIALDPESPSALVTDPHADRVRARSYRKAVELDYKGVDPEDENRTHCRKHCLPPVPEHPRKDCLSSSRRDLNAVSGTSISRRRSPIDPFTRTPKRSDSHNLEMLTASWPVEDESTNDPAAKPDPKPALTTHVPVTSIAITPISTATAPSTALDEQEKDFSAEHILSRLMIVFGLQTASQRVTPTSLRVIYTSRREGANSFFHGMIHLLMACLIAFLFWRWREVVHELWAWEHANGVGFSEGYGDVDDGYGPYGIGHPLLGMLPYKLLSADSRLPAKAIEVITRTVSAFEGLIRLVPTPVF